jgi:DNA-binding transcriptional LysR family regulator
VPSAACQHHVGTDGAERADPTHSCRDIGGNSTSVHTYYSFQYALALVAAGEGITLISSLALEGSRTDGVDALHIPGLGMRRVALRTLTRRRGASPSLDMTTSLIREAAASFSYEVS